MQANRYIDIRSSYTSLLFRFRFKGQLLILTFPPSYLLSLFSHPTPALTHDAPQFYFNPSYRFLHRKPLPSLW